MNFKEEAKNIVSIISQFKNILIVIKGSPDPDAIASAFALKIICEHYKIHSTILAYKTVSLKQNKILIDKLKIPIVYWNERFNYMDYDSYAIVDFQNTKIDNMPPSIPCILHIDHHEICKQEREPKYSIIEPQNVSATSTIFVFILKELSINMSSNLSKRLSTALVYGIVTDTDNFTHCNDIDKDAFKLISEHRDNSVLKKISKMGYSKLLTNILKKVHESKTVYKNCLITGIGYIKHYNRDIIAIIADGLIQDNTFDLVIVFAIIEENYKNLTLDASLRTKHKDFDLNGFIKEMAQDGGGRRYKGAYQLNLSYFDENNKETLWKYIYDTTLNRLMKKIDNKAIFFQTTGFFNNFKSLFQK